MKRVLLAFVFLAATAAFAKNPVADANIKIKDQDANGVPTFVTGEIGRLGAGNVEKASKDFLKAQKHLLQMEGSEDFDVTSSIKDELGQTHVKMQERLRGLPVVGAEYVIHADASGKVFAMNGRFVAENGKLPRHPSIDGYGAVNRALLQAGIFSPLYDDSPELLYVVNEKSNAFLAWRATVSYFDGEGPQKDRIYADATTGDLVLRDAQYKRARNRQTYTANNGSSLPGTLRRSETTPAVGDVALDNAHDYAGNVYDYYKTIFNRDSYDNAGATIRSTVHYLTNYNNAFWTGSQMVYGDGDGTTFIALSRALDVDAHELTHAVTERTANLVYANESGALNEAMSDVLGNSCEAWVRGISSNTWKVGEDIYTPGTAGDALRFMNDPAGMGDMDYYPTRYTGTADHGGVHTNSGIANLAYYLMVVGGTHPRGKTTVSVPALSGTQTTSLDMGQRIWYRALTVYMTSSTNFQGARNATAQAATDLYGAAATDSVHKAWDAVGAPGTPGGGGGVTTLTNGQTVSSLSASTGTWKHYKIAVPASQTQLKIIQSGGTGDADLYVKRGAQPTSSSYDYRPYLNGNNETVTVPNPVAGDWYISIYAYSTYSGVSLNATYTGAAACTTYSGSLSGTGATQYQPSSSGYVSSVSGTHTGKLTGPGGTDFDLYLQKWNGSTWANVAAGETSTSVENVSYSGTSGTYRWRVYAYSGSGSYTLCTTKP